MNKFFVLILIFCLQGCFPVKTLDVSEIVGEPVDVCKNILPPSPGSIAEIKDIEVKEDLICFSYEGYEDILYNFQEATVYIKMLKIYAQSIKECYQITNNIGKK